MNILTNGREFVHAQPQDTATTDRVSYGPYVDRVDAGRADEPLHWWGSFERGDRVWIEVRKNSGDVRVEILDTSFHPVASGTFADDSSWLFRTSIPRSGVVHLRFHAARDFSFRLIRDRAPRSLRIPSRLQSFLASLVGSTN